MVQKKYIYAEAANGLTVRIPAERYPQWKAVQEEIKAGKRKTDPQQVRQLASLMEKK